MTASTAKSRKERLVGAVIQDRFLVKKRLAAGGMGVVYLAEQIPLGRPVALKVMEPRHEEEDDAQFSERFLLEAAAVARLSHPNTITLYDYGETDDGLFFYAMEFVDGINLRNQVRKTGPLDPADAIHVALQVAGSVREAHRASMIHRDLKPGNIMIAERHDDPWFVKVLDFGLVKLLEHTDGADLTQSGMLLGSPRYMAPEQVLGSPLDHRVDVYALGAVLYYALTGQPMFTHDSKFEVMRAQVDDHPRSFRKVYPECAASPRLEDAVMRCLAKDPDDRFKSMTELAEELIACARELGVEEPSLSGSSRVLDTLPEGQRLLGASEPAERVTLPEPVAARSEIQRRSEPEPAPEAQPVAEEEESGSRMGLYLALAAVAGLAVSLGTVVTVVLLTRPEPAPQTAEPPAGDQPAERLGEARPVRIESRPVGARVRRGDEDLGDAPFSLEIPEGERWELTVSLDGYEERTLTVTSGRDELMVHLRPLEDRPEDVEDDAPEPSHAARPASGPRRPGSDSTSAPPEPRALGGPRGVTPTRTPTITPTPSPTPSGGNSDLRHPWGRP